MCFASFALKHSGWFEIRSCCIFSLKAEISCSLTLELKRKNQLLLGDQKEQSDGCLMHELCHSLELGFLLRATQIRKASRPLNRTETKTNKGSICCSDELI